MIDGQGSAPPASRAVGSVGAPVPLYYRLRETLRSQIQAGELAPGNAIPTESALIAQYGVSRTTVREAIGGLVQEGLLYRQQGKGTFVAAERVEEDLGALTGFTEEMTARGLVPGARLLSADAVSLDAHDAGLLELEVGAKAYRIVRLRLADGQPFSIEEATFPFDVGLRLAQEDLNTIGYYPLLEERYGIRLSEAEQVIAARPATPDEATILGLRRGDSVLTLERVTSDVTGRRIELTRGAYRADRYSYHIHLRRRHGGV